MMSGKPNSSPATELEDTAKRSPAPITSFGALIKSISPYAAVGTVAAACIETAGFHGVSTAQTLLMRNPNKLPEFSSKAFFPEFNKVVFKSAAEQRYGQRVAALWRPGFKWGVIYKAFERSHNLLLQPIIAAQFQSQMGDSKAAAIAANGLSGFSLGASQVIYLPFDALKTQGQLAPLEAAPPTFRGQRLSTLYKGSSTYAVRSGGSAGVLFATIPVVKDAMLSLSDSKSLTPAQSFAANALSATAAVAATNPLDVVKTRIQANAHANVVAKAPVHPVSGWKVAARILAQEGPLAFGKGLVPKVATIAPRIATVLTLAPVLTEKAKECVAAYQNKR